MQDKKPIAFYSRKLNAAQRRYTTTERELLSTIENCKEYKNILLGYPIIVHTDHKNNTFNGLKASDCVLSWLLLLEEYGVTPRKEKCGSRCFISLRHWWTDNSTRGSTYTSLRIRTL
jgi:RNase H-like domain found in reverse transcriptase